MSTLRTFGLLLLTATLACGTDVTEFPGAGGSGGSGASGASGGSGGGGGADPCDCTVGASVPVCGEDGMTYDAACGEQCVPVPIDCQGACPCVDETCAGLEKQYADALAKAKECSLMVPVEQCLTQANDALACPCPTFVNDSEAKNKMDQLQAQWDMLDCGADIACPEIACPDPAGGQCIPDPNGTGGVCSDVMP